MNSFFVFSEGFSAAIHCRRKTNLCAAKLDDVFLTLQNDKIVQSERLNYSAVYDMISLLLENHLYDLTKTHLYIVKYMTDDTAGM